MSFFSNRAIQDALPAGVIFPYAGGTAPNGWMLCDGSAISRTTYAALFSTISTTYGVGDGSTTFNLPNTQGVFLRGAGSQTISSVSYSGTRGTTEGDQIQGHGHAFNRTSGTTLSSSATAYLASASGSNAGPVTSVVVGAATDSSYGTLRVGSQTYPANVSVSYIIKV